MKLKGKIVLCIAPEVNFDIYVIIHVTILHALVPCSHMGGDSFVNHSSDEVPINVKSFTGSGAMVRVEKRQGMESVSLLAGDAESASEKKEKKEGNLWNSLSK